jgi:autotransporter-associated beta strand protein
VLVASGQGTVNQSLAAVASVSGAYRIRVWGNNSTSGEYFLGAAIDPSPPTATFTPVTPSPRNTPVDQVQIVFNEPVTGLTLADFSLAVGGGPNLLTTAQTLTTSDNTVYTVGNLGPVTNSVGTYSLTLAADANVADSNGGYLAAGATSNFVVNVPALVTTMADSGPGSLRQALVDASGAPGLTHTIEFELPAGTPVIGLLSPLPAVGDPLVAVVDAGQHVVITAPSGAAWEELHAVTKSGDGTLTLGEAGRFDGAIAVTAGLLTLQAATTPSFAGGVSANTSGAGTLELAGPVSALTASVNIINNSVRPGGVVVSGAHQLTGIISGAGSLGVVADGDLTACRIEQTALIIGGTVGHPARLAVAANLNGGNGLSATASAGPATGTFVAQPGEFSPGAPQQPASATTGHELLDRPQPIDLASVLSALASFTTVKPFALPAVGLVGSDAFEHGLTDAAISTDQLAGGTSLTVLRFEILTSYGSPTARTNTPRQPISRGLSGLTGLFQAPKIAVIARAAHLQLHDDVIYELACDEQCRSSIAAILEGLFDSDAWPALESVAEATQVSRVVPI